MYGGVSLLVLLMQGVPGYADHPLRHDLWRAGHAHAGVYLVLSLVMLRYVDEARLSAVWKWLARTGAHGSVTRIRVFLFSARSRLGAERADILVC